MHLNDDTLRDRILQALRSTTRADPTELRIEVRDSVVTLSGAVDSTLEKRRARNLVEEVEGVAQVIDTLRVKDFVARPDDELVQAVRAHLRRDAFTEETAAGIEVYASNGEVRLDGKVPTYADRKSAEDVAWWTPGVTNVENLLLVTEEHVDAQQSEVVGQ